MSEVVVCASIGLEHWSVPIYIRGLGTQPERPKQPCSPALRGAVVRPPRVSMQLAQAGLVRVVVTYISPGPSGTPTDDRGYGIAGAGNSQIAAARRGAAIGSFRPVYWSS
jgi:hypothetical protein